MKFQLSLLKFFYLSKELVVIGGGAAGFFCAVNAARMNPSLKVTIVEKSNKLLSKVKISGGGRCNVTHSCFDIIEMSRKYPRGGNFVKKTFHQFFTTNTIQWFKERGVKLKAEADGRMFPVTDSSQTIIDCLMKEANRYGVQIMMRSEVRGLSVRTSLDKYEQGQFTLDLDGSRSITADYVCIACGGYSKSSMFDWLRLSGHTIEDPVPSLFTFNIPSHPVTRLMGVSVDPVTIRIMDSKLEESGPVLFTHWGLSGPAVLRLSAWGARELKERNWGFGIRVNWLPGIHDQALRERMQHLRSSAASQLVTGKNIFGLPQRLWELLVEQSEIKTGTRWADLPGRQQNRLIHHLTNYEFRINGKTTFKEEFVTAGGIRLSEVDANTMMSKKVQRLFFAGEVLDVDGITGGFNFQHAWTSGFIAAKNIAAMP
ncbi:MAG: NAD(P)/FAD-dependent oxidoreductase [Chitinophagaceae bacterium]|nr:NAD(P)/FAD-dependent oxidoreductase [Chitinophagaceae bacterium]